MITLYDMNMNNIYDSTFEYKKCENKKQKILNQPTNECLQIVVTDCHEILILIHYCLRI